MADILIKNIEIDEGCYYCPFLLRKNNCFCAITSSTIRIEEVRENDDARMDDCPLIFLPEHGRLISDTDVKALLRSGLSLDTDADIDYVCGLIDGLPTIVEATE